MLGLMQNQALLISSLIEFADLQHGDTEIVSRRVEGDIHRTNWRGVAARARQVAHALDAMRLPAGSRIATLAWNGYRHLELYYGVSGTGRVVHTINPRLHPDQLAWMVNHAESSIVCFDLTFVPLVQAIHARCASVRTWIALCDAADLPADTGIPGLASYEAWIAGHPTHYDWPEFDENTASGMCYTSGTTGHPKAVLYSHRSTLLHAYAVSLPDAMNLSARDTVLPVVPMFHVNAWGLPYSAALAGAKLVFPGPALDGQSIFDLIESERVTFAGGVPTVWQALLDYMLRHERRFSTLQRTVVGGSACPPAMLEAFQVNHGVEVLHAWGMTELSPLGTICSLKTRHLALDSQAQDALRAKQGRPVFGIDLKILDGAGCPLPWDGRSAGDLMVRGHWVARDYFKNDGASLLITDDQGRGWFPTGDVATIDADGFLQITDRSKDLIKSGGEWISSIDIENIAAAHPGIALAACIGVPHPKWDERPLLVALKRPGSTVTRDALLAFYQGKAAKWQIPDDVVFVDAMPLGATGKIMKASLREQFRDYLLP